MNQKIVRANEEDSPLKILGTLFLIGCFYTFLCLLALPYLNIQNAFFQAAIGAYVVSSFITFTFYYLYILPYWGKITNDRSFIDQQIKGLNEVAIISSSDRFGNIVSVNDNFCKISGFSREELLGKNHRLVKSDEHSKKFYSQMWNTITRGEIWQGQLKNKAKDGSTYWVYSNIIPLRNHETGRIDEFISIRFNITNEKKLEEELETEQAKSIHMGRLAALGEMAGSVAHEINNPVAVIVGKVHIMKRSLETIEDKTLRETLSSKMNTIEEHAKRIAKIVKGLREFSHGGENNQQEEITSTKLFETVFELCGEKIKTNSVILKSHHPEIKFNSPRLQLEQVLVNLVNNAVDAIADKQEKWIELKMHETEHFVCFSVTDSGTGIAPENVNKIMLPFFTTKAVGKGTGLGLSISKGLIEKMGGDFYYDKQCPNTSFKVAIPKSENSLFYNLEYETVINSLEKIKQKLEHRLTMDQIETQQGEFSLKIPECPLHGWLIKYEACLGKNDDYKDLKSTHEIVCNIIGEIEWKYINKKLCNETEIAKSKQSLDQAIGLMILKLTDVRAKRVVNSTEQGPGALAS